jgi:hypothetical protein
MDFSQRALILYKRMLRNNHDISNIVTREFDGDQLEQILYGLNYGIDILPYINKNHSWLHIKYLIEAKMLGNDISKFNLSDVSIKKLRVLEDYSFVFIQFEDTEANWVELDLNLTKRLRIRRTILWAEIYSKLQEMGKPISKKLLTKLDHLDAFQLAAIRYGILNRCVFEKYLDQKFNYRQLMQLNFASLSDIDMTCMINPKFSWRQMQEIRLGLENGIYVNNYYLDEDIPFDKMREIRLLLKHDDFRNSNSTASLKRFSTEQLRQIRLCLDSGVKGVEKYFSDTIDPYFLKRIRLLLLSMSAKESIKTLLDTLPDSMNHANLEILIEAAIEGVDLLKGLGLN